MNSRIAKIGYFLLLFSVLIFFLWQNTKNYGDMFPSHLIAIFASLIALTLISTVIAHAYIALKRLFLKTPFPVPTERWSLVLYTMIIIAGLWREIGR